MAPGDPADCARSADGDGGRCRAAARTLGSIGRSIVQSARWAGAVVRGTSVEKLSSRLPVSRLLRDAAPVSFALGGISLLLTFLVGVPIGMFQAARRDRALDRLATLLTTAVYAAPTFWICARPGRRSSPPTAGDYGLPAGAAAAAFGIRTPGAVHSTDGRPWSISPACGAARGNARCRRRRGHRAIRAQRRRGRAAGGWVHARAKGARPLWIYGRHVLRNITPQLDRARRTLAPRAGRGIGVRGICGVPRGPASGRTCSSAIQARDYPVVMGATVFYAAAVILANLAADLALPFFDPRRMSHGA